MRKLKIGFDIDDVTAPFNSLAIAMANEKYGLELKLEDVTSWDNTGKASVIKEFYSDAELYARQTASISEINKSCIKQLAAKHEIYFISAVAPEFMTTRANQIMTWFPEIPVSHIMLGGSKDICHLDFLVDDNINNILTSSADYPVLMRKPWNQSMTGLLSVNSIEEFICLVETIEQMNIVRENVKKPTVIALVGPSGSNKNEIAAKLIADSSEFEKVVGYTTFENDRTSRKLLTEEEFGTMDFIAKTRYAGHGYGILKEDVAKILNSGKSCVIPIDICGAIGMKKEFPTTIIYIKNDKCKIIKNILDRNDLDNDEKTLRIVSIEAEKKNRNICDFEFPADVAVEKIKSLF